MVASLAFRLGWIAAVFLGQRYGWAFGATNCTSFSLSGLGEADGIYTEQHRSETHYRASRGGVEPYEIEDNSYDDFWWIQRSADYEYNLKYRTNDLAADHPVDITSEWVECVDDVCADEGLDPQPVFTCEDVPTCSPPSPSTCTSVNVSGVGELDGTYTWEYPGEYTASATTPENLYVRVDNGTFELRGYGWIWYLVEDEASRYRTWDDVVHPADITTEWGECIGIPCAYELAVSQPLITCVESSSEGTPAPTPSACTSFTLAGADDLDGTYTEASCTEYSSSPYEFYASRLEGTEKFEIARIGFTWWIQNADRSIQYQAMDYAEHPVDITSQFDRLECVTCAYVIQPVFTCAGPSPSPTTAVEETDGAPVGGGILTPAPSIDARDVDDGETGGTDAGGARRGGGISITATVGIIAGMVLIL